MSRGLCCIQTGAKIATAAKPLALRASEVALAISKATYALAIGEPPGQLVAATPVADHAGIDRDDHS